MEIYRRHRNYVVKLNKQTKRNHFNQLDDKSQDKDFWKLVKPFLNSNCQPNDKNILLVEDSQIISDSKEIATLFNSYYHNITTSLNLYSWEPDYNYLDDDPIKTAVKKFDSHPSISKIKSNFDSGTKFHFKHTNKTEVMKVIMKMDDKKKTSGTISSKLLKSNIEICSQSISDCINHAIDTGVFPSKLKTADIIPIHKKDDTMSKSNYRPISILPSVSKIFEKIMFSQLNTHFELIFNSLLCGFRKGYDTQHAILNLLQIWQKSLDKGEIVGTILMDLSKAYDCIPHDLLIAKLAAYGLSEQGLKFMYSYLNGRKHRVKVNDSLSEWLDMKLGVPQGSILGPLLFNIFINDIFFFIIASGICNFADDNSLHASGTSLEIVITKLKIDIKNILEWFRFNSMAANPGKFQIMFLGLNENTSINFDIGDISISSTNHVKLLGVTIDNKLDFSKHIEAICKQASQKTSAILRIRNYLSIDKASKLVQAFILSRFFYCPLIWMFCNRKCSELINRTHKRALRTLLFDFNLNFDELLKKTGQLSIHCRHLQFLLIEVFKSLNKENPKFMWDLFQIKTSKYNLRAVNTLKLITPKTNKYGLNSIVFRGSFLWNYIPNELKRSLSLSDFKSKVRKYKSFNCTCLSCR